MGYYKPWPLDSERSDLSNLTNCQKDVRLHTNEEKDAATSPLSSLIHLSCLSRYLSALRKGILRRTLFMHAFLSSFLPSLLILGIKLVSKLCLNLQVIQWSIPTYYLTQHFLFCILRLCTLSEQDRRTPHVPKNSDGQAIKGQRDKYYVQLHVLWLTVVFGYYPAPWSDFILLFGMRRRNGSWA